MIREPNHWAFEACDRGWIPDWLIRACLRRLIDKQLTSDEARDPETRSEAERQLIEHASTGPVADHAHESNEQNCQVPSEFFGHVLGTRRKYSSCLFEPGIENLDQAEHAMLALTVERAGLANEQRILDLGCGWGSLALWVAERYPRSCVHAVSNSETQTEFISTRATERGLDNLTVEVCDINHFDPGDDVFDRVLSIELFECMRNYHALFRRISRWLSSNGRLFVHVVAHKLLAYRFTDERPDGWMVQNPFPGKAMPNEHLFAHFQTDLLLYDHWWLSGTHYRATADTWLARLDANHDAVHSLFQDIYGTGGARQIQRWRLFFMAIAECLGYDDGNQWGIGHYLFGPRLEIQKPKTSRAAGTTYGHTT